MSVPIGMTAAEATAQLAQMTAPQKWKLAVEVNEQATDPLMELEGKSKSSFVIAATQADTDEGQHVNIKVRSGFYAEGKKGTELFETDADFEKRKGISYAVVFGPHRHGSAYQRGVAVKQGIETDLKNGTPEELGNWLGRKKWEEAAMTLVNRTPSVNRMFAGGKTLDSLLSTDILDRNTIIIGNGLMKRYGGGMANAGGLFNGQVRMRTCAIAPSPAMTRLKLDPAYQAAVQTAAALGKDNPWFTGEVVDLDHCAIREHNAIAHDGDGPIGSPLNPEAVLGVEISPGTATFAMSFGEDTAAIKYSKWFPGYNYTFTEGDTLAVPAITLLGSPSFIHGAAGTTANIDTGGEHYLMVINPPTAGFMQDGTTAYVPNAIGYYAYHVGNDGHDIDITARLGSATGGQGVGVALGSHYRGRVTTLASIANTAASGTVANGGVAGAATVPGSASSVTWGAGTYGGRTLTDRHPVGSLVLPCNVRGVPFGYIPLLGGGGLMRAYGQVRNHRATEEAEGGFVKKVYVESDWGHRIRIDRLGRSPGVVLIGCALSDPSLPLPQVNS